MNGSAPHVKARRTRAPGERWDRDSSLSRVTKFTEAAQVSRFCRLACGPTRNSGDPFQFLGGRLTAIRDICSRSG